MERNDLVEELKNYCLDYGVVIDERELKNNIEKGLGKVEIIESLYNMVFKKAKSGKVRDIERVKELLIELEKIRLELEFKDHDLRKKGKRSGFKKA